MGEISRVGDFHGCIHCCRELLRARGVPWAGLRRGFKLAGATLLQYRNKVVRLRRSCVMRRDLGGFRWSGCRLIMNDRA